MERDTTGESSGRKQVEIRKSPKLMRNFNRFFLSPDETQIWNVYHATSNSQGACDGNRYTMAQPVNWNADGTPNFGRAPQLSAVLAGPSGE
jgi:GH43 family beta-xylosidase